MTEPNEAPDSTEPLYAKMRQRRPRTFASHPLPSNRHPFAVHFEVLRRFVSLARNGGGIPANAVEGNGVPIQASSLNVRFLVSIGLLTATKKGLYAPTDLARQFITARTISDDKARSILTQALSAKWFADAAQSAFRTKPVMSEEDLMGEIAWAAQTEKDKEGPALRVIVDYLVYAGLITRDARGLGWAPQDAQGSGEATIPESVTIPTVSPATTSPPEKGSVAAPGWHILSTEDFYVKVKSDLDVVQDLIDHLQPLKKKIERLRTQAGSPSEERHSENEPGRLQA